MLKLQTCIIHVVAILSGQFWRRVHLQVVKSYNYVDPVLAWHTFMKIIKIPSYLKFTFSNNSSHS